MNLMILLLFPSQTWALFRKLLAKYQNGYILQNAEPTTAGYSQEWLEASGYPNYDAANNKDIKKLFDQQKKRLDEAQKFADRQHGVVEELGVL
jgi:hypothetical protein